MKNLLTDVAGVSVGHADDAVIASGVTAILFERPAVGLDRCPRRRSGHPRGRAAVPA
ncbi:L-aminopeptidase/D-esterase-like protein [Bradyrhizobium sp. JR6.1]